MIDYCARLWQCRFFWLGLALSDLRTRYRRSFLGIWWSLLHPIMMTIVLCVVFHRIFHVDVREFLPYLFCGLAFWHYFTTSTILGCQCFFHGQAYIRQYPVPLATYPLRTVLSSAFHFLTALVCAVAMTAILRGLESPMALLSLPFTLGLLLVFGWAMATLTGVVSVYFPDAAHLFEIGLQMLFYATPVMYPREMLDRGGLSALVLWNPLASFLELLRAPILEGRMPGAPAVIMATGVTALLASLAVLILAKSERRLVFYL